MLIVYIIIVAAVAYVLGGLNGAIIISKIFFNKDVRGFGSGNAGLTNFMRAFGSGQALFVVFIDFLKCVTACLFGGWMLSRFGKTMDGKAIAGLFTVIGHMFPAFYKFKGGKGIMTGAAMALMLDWRVFVAVVAVFAVMTAVTKMVSVGSIAAAACLPVTTDIFVSGNITALAMTIITGALVIFMHRGNIVRIVHGEERKLTLDQFRKR